MNSFEQNRDWPSCKWLAAFFRETGQSKSTFVAVLDSQNEELQKCIFVSRTDRELLSAVLRQPSQAATCCIIATYECYIAVEKEYY
jgi:hypothetical protein